MLCSCLLYTSFEDYDDLYGKYETLEKISFDYAVVEKEPKIAVMRFAGQWKDLGTWNTLTEAMEESCVGDAILNETCENVHAVSYTHLDVYKRQADRTAAAIRRKRYPIFCMAFRLIISAR